MLNSTNLRPTGRLVLSKALYQEVSEGGLAIPWEWQERYPNVGLVYDIGPKCREDIRAGDIAIFSTEMFDSPNTYLDCFEIVLRDGEKDVRILVDFEIEPIFRDQMLQYQRNPSTEDRWITVKNIDENDLGYKFLASDVLSFGPAQMQASSFQKLRYVETRMFSLLDGERERLFYLTDERYIEAVIR